MASSSSVNAGSSYKYTNASNSNKIQAKNSNVLPLQPLTFVFGLSDAVSWWLVWSSWSVGDSALWASSRPCSSSGGSSGGSESSAYDTRFWIFRRISSCSRSRNWMWKTPSCSASHFPWVVFPDPLTPSMKTRSAGGWLHTNRALCYMYIVCHILYIFVIYYLFSQMQKMFCCHFPMCVFIIYPDVEIHVMNLSCKNIPE